MHKVAAAGSDLRPSGWSLIDEKKLFVVSEGEFIDNGDKVKILSGDGNRIVVRKVNNEN